MLFWFPSALRSLVSRDAQRQEALAIGEVGEAVAIRLATLQRGEGQKWSGAWPRASQRKGASEAGDLGAVPAYSHVAF